MTKTPYLEYLYILAIVALVFFLSRILIRQYREKRAARQRFKRGAKLEKRGRDYLIEQGYKIEHEQYLAHHTFYVNHKEESIGIIPDYIVSKAGKTYIVDVKSGRSAISYKDKSTRRQMLEYDTAIPNDGIFILDMEHEQLIPIAFQSWRPNNGSSPRGSSHKTLYRIIGLLSLIIILLLAYIINQ